MKSYLKIFGLIIMSIITISLFVSCNTDTNATDGETPNRNTTENKPYELSIDPTPVTPPPSAKEPLEISADIKREIQIADLLEQYGEEYENCGFAPEQVWVACYGIFDNVYCCIVTTPGEIYTDSVTEIEVAGYTFSFESSNVMSVYVEGEFYSLKTAYENGILDSADIAELYAYYMN